MITVSVNIFKRKLIYTCIGTCWTSTSKALFLCVFYKQLKRTNSKKKNVYTYSHKQNKRFYYLEEIVHRNRGYAYLSTLCTVDGSFSKIRRGKTRENVRFLFVFLRPLVYFFPFLAVANSFFCNVTDCGY